MVEGGGIGRWLGGKRGEEGKREGGRGEREREVHVGGIRNGGGGREMAGREERRGR